MACLKGPSLPHVPDIVAQLDAAIALPHVNLGLCCNMPPINGKLPLVPPLPPVVLQASTAPINAFIDELNDLLDEIPIGCPFE